MVKCVNVIRCITPPRHHPGEGVGDPVSDKGESGEKGVLCLSLTVISFEKVHVVCRYILPILEEKGNVWESISEGR